jgi:hypothetical protein
LEAVFEKIFGEVVQAIRMNYYPTCSRPDLVLGLSPHSDGSALTVLQQAKGSPVGLQMLLHVINIGDKIEVRGLITLFYFPFYLIF